MEELVAKPVDPFLKKNGAGLELPISISGTQGDVHFGLALHGTAEESNQAMARDLRTNRQEMLDEAKAKRERDKEAKAQQEANNSDDGKQAKAERKAEKEREKAEKHEARAAAEKNAGQAGQSEAPSQSGQTAAPQEPASAPELQRRPANPPQ